TFDDTSSAIVRGYPELNESSTFFVTTSLEQGPITGVWENTLESTPVYVNVVDEDGNSAVMQLSVSRDAYKTDGSSSIHTIMNSGIIYGKDNALIIEYNNEDNPDLVSGKRYTATEFLVIDAKLWSDKSLREQLQVDIDVTIP
ncbi:MAG: hypothetical protein GXO11_05345, partial [Epsilonproteobacteria bacterium]|nr:hypothetical protein [Campylobacterota bacterium]